MCYVFFASLQGQTGVDTARSMFDVVALCTYFFIAHLSVEK